MKKESKDLPKLSDQDLAKAKGGVAEQPCACSCSRACVC
jgi:hypothetical protein